MVGTKQAESSGSIERRRDWSRGKSVVTSTSHLSLILGAVRSFGTYFSLQGAPNFLFHLLVLPVRIGHPERLRQGSALDSLTQSQRQNPPCAAPILSRKGGAEEVALKSHLPYPFAALCQIVTDTSFFHPLTPMAIRLPWPCLFLPNDTQNEQCRSKSPLPMEPRSHARE